MVKNINIDINSVESIINGAVSDIGAVQDDINKIYSDLNKCLSEAFGDEADALREQLTVERNIKDQLLFSYTGVREENRKVEFGYYHNAGVNRKVKLIFHREMK